MDEKARLVVNEYIGNNPRSKNLFEWASRYEPGGVTRSIAYFPPYPLYITKGEGCYIYDVDGNRRLDFLNNFTSTILGHAHPKVVGAVREQLADGTAYSYSNEKEIRLAELLCERVPSLEQMRFTNSGMEATMFALRAARAFTGRERIAKFEGGYHGTTEYVQVSVKPPLEAAGNPAEPIAILDAAGVPSGVLEGVVVLPFNNAQAVQVLLEKHGHSLAALIVEPILGACGVIPPREDFLAFLRDITRHYGIVLIFDEVITLRLAPGGGQQYYGVIPDMTATGKIIGGGFPVGAFGGRRDIMSVFAPTVGSFDPFDPRLAPAIYQGGTFSGNPITMAAGIATLEELSPEEYARINALGDSLRAGVNRTFTDLGLRGVATGAGSLFHIHFGADDVRDYRSAQSISRQDKERWYRVFVRLLNRGILLATRGMGSISTPMTTREIEVFLQTFRGCLEEEQR